MTSITERIGGLLDSSDISYEPSDFLNKMLILGAGFGIGVGLIFFNIGIELTLLIAASVFIIFEALVAGLLIVTANNRITAIEASLPDFMSIMASNIKSGLTYDRALLLSARKELGPLAKEIDRAAKEALTGRPLTESLLSMTDRVHSEVLSKTIRLIVEGVNSGGNLADLLEITSLDLRRFASMRQEVSATVMTYQLFMVAAACFGAPLIYAVTTFLLKIITVTKAKITATAGEMSFLPMFQNAGGISPEVVYLFALGAIAITTFFGALAIGVIGKGKESEGYPYFPLMLAIGFAVFFLTRALLDAISSSLFPGIV
jgi:flagellar protein FlaJ